MKFLAFLLLFSNVLFSQSEYPKDYFGAPLDIPLQLSGNFGELRPNHFHAGLDLKTMQKEGLKVRAIADGYVSRIKISTFGNGKTIYINHPNGFTSVYSHLQTGVDAIEKYIKKTHYKEKSFEIEMFLKPDELVVKKGQLLALSGNTGSSEGPHLHFEIRDTKSEKVINPLLFGYDKYIRDSKKPVISALYVYPVDSKTTVNNAKRPILLNMSLQKDGTYLTEKVVANGKVGFGVTASDYDDVSFNKNGVFKVQSFINGKPNFGYEFETYSFDEMRYINALIDYSKYKKSNVRVQKLFMKNKYGLSLIESDENFGVITAMPNLATVCRIEVADFYGNKSTVTIPIQYNVQPTVIEKETVVSNYFIKANKDSNFEKDNCSVFFPAGTFYEDFDMNFKVINDTMMVHDDTVPVHSNFTLSFVDQKRTEEEKSKLFIGLIQGKKVSYLPTFRKDSLYTAKSKTLGTYTLVLDQSAPKITIAKSVEGKWLTSQKSLQFTISDSLSGIKSYNGYLNGKWVLFEYDNKTKKITHNFSDGIVAEGANDLKVVVTDNVGNSSTFTTRFFRSQKNK